MSIAGKGFQFQQYKVDRSQSQDMLYGVGGN